MPSRQELANAIRILSMDAVQQANSGHPGMPMGMADIAQVLWQDFLVHNPADPHWLNRDRFILSNGHGSMLLYALLNLTGYDLPISELKKFRQLHSKTPGHPEFAETPGVETTTGPLGQGIGNAVGMALAERLLAEQFNRPTHAIIDHWTYAFIGDGCLMEGISHEVCALAGTLGLGKLVAFWDDNSISIDGHVAPWFSDDTPARFEAYGWEVIRGVDGHDPEAIKAAVEQARAQTERPTLICCRTTIGLGAPSVQGTEKCHGAPLGDAEIAAARKALGWQSTVPFDIPQPIADAWSAREKGRAQQESWDALWSDYSKTYPELATELKRRSSAELPAGWENLKAQFIEKLQAEKPTMATRKASLAVINAWMPSLPECLGGSADLTGSNLTKHAAAISIKPGKLSGDYVHYGVREFGMAAIMNGLALHGGFIPFGGTFLTFVDYMRNAVRLSALMQQKVIYVLTHDSIGLGEDGPTHQPVEQLASLRAMPGLETWRPCDALETAVAWGCAIEHQGPTALSLTRQNVPYQPRTSAQIAQIEKGAYILFEQSKTPDVILIATGSEVALVMAAAEALAKENLSARVVSMPCQERFLNQPKAYQDMVLPPMVTARVAVEAASSMGWHQFVGLHGQVIGLDRFGVSAPASDAYKELGFTVENIVAASKAVAL